MSECTSCNDRKCCKEPNKRVCNDILESIALEETGIAHVLNAEGEKIQKAVEMATDIDCLLAVNNSVVRTLVHITHLEQTLYRKLELVLEECKCCRCAPNCECKRF